MEEGQSTRFIHHWRAFVENTQATEIAMDVLSRVHTQDTLEASVTLAAQQTQNKRNVSWHSASVAQGYAGLAILDSYLDACFPNAAWDRSGHMFLSLASQDIQEAPSQFLSLFGGLCGVAFSAWLLSRGGTRYSNMLASFDGAIVPRCREHLQQMREQQRGFSSGQYDAISGLSGVGAYLLCRKEYPETRAVLHELIRLFIAMTEEEEEIPHWYTPAERIMQDHWQGRYPGGLLDSGMAHGIAGPLAFLALAMLHGEAVADLDLGIECMACWLAQHRRDDQWGVNWGTAYPADDTGMAPIPARCAWCYGAPGIARALWLAGVALDRDEYRDLAIAAMEAVYKKPVEARMIDAPNLCHGVAGLLQITLRFANDTNLPLFHEAAQELTRQLVSLYEPDSLLGYRDREYTNFIDRADLLNGSTGVALALLAATCDREPIWDRLFLLS